jgi:protein ImuB
MIFCVMVLYFVAEVELRFRSALSDEIYVLRENTGAIPRIAAVSKAAAQLDIHQGMALRHAQTLVPELQVLPLCPPRYRQSVDRLVDTLSTFSDHVEVIFKGWGEKDKKIPQSVESAALPSNPLVAFIDVGKLKPQALHSLGQQLQAALKLNHFTAQIGVATNRFTAWVAAFAAREGNIAVVPQGEEKWMLMCHPISLLPLDAKILDNIGLLSVRNFGDYARLPRTGIRARFGAQGVVAHQLAQGIDDTPIQRISRETRLKRREKQRAKFVLRSY